MFDLSDYQVGDEFEGSPSELGRFISAILAEGGTFNYEGRSVTITSFPNREKKAAMKASSEESVATKAPSVPETVAPPADPVPTQEPSVSPNPPPPEPAPEPAPEPVLTPKKKPAAKFSSKSAAKKVANSESVKASNQESSPSQ